MIDQPLVILGKDAQFSGCFQGETKTCDPTFLLETHGLFRRLRRDPSKILRRYFHFDDVADICIRFDFTRFRQFNFVLRIGHFVRDYEVCQRPDFSSFRIDVDP